MGENTTKYGELQGLIGLERYGDGGIKECTLNQPNELVTDYGVLVPQYENEGPRRKYGNSLSFYEDGQLKSIALHTQQPIRTPIGVFPAELITFYPGGAIRRLFPLNGKISGFWSEANEYGLAQVFPFEFPFGSFTAKIISIHFYETRAVNSLTFWPGEKITVQAPVGRVEVRNGLALYPDGQLKSLEPHKPIRLTTPIGELTAYNNQPVGVHGDCNSLVFASNGAVASLLTTTNRITVIDRQKNMETSYQPGRKQSLFNEEMMDVIPLAIEFTESAVKFNQQLDQWYQLSQYRFEVSELPDLPQSSCSCLEWDFSQHQAEQS